MAVFFLVLGIALGLVVWISSLVHKIAGLSWQVEHLTCKVEQLERGLSGSTDVGGVQPQVAAEPAVKTAEAQASSIFEPLPQTEQSVSARVGEPEMEILAEKQPEPQPQLRHVPAAPITLDKLFSWIGGFVLLLGVIFCIKYSIEKNLISPATRVVLGVLGGIALWTGGAFIRKENLKTTSHTLLACGLCMCYLVLFAGYHFYHIIPADDAFVLLAITAVAAFATAVWKRAFYVGILAQIIGFLTPFLLHSGVTPVYWFLLGYGALVTVSAVIAAVKCNWDNQIYVAIVLSALYSLAFSVTPHNIYLVMGFALVSGVVFAAAAYWRNNGKFLLGAFISQIPLLLVLFADTALFSRNADGTSFLIMTVWWWILFALVPLACKVRFIADKMAWITSGAAGFFAGTLLQIFVSEEFPEFDGGWVPFIFALVYAGIFYAVYVWKEITDTMQHFRLSLLGAAGVFFMAMATCLALHNQWLPMALALEGACLICLWHKIKLPVWQNMGIVLLSLGMLQLFCTGNFHPIVFLLNWYLYTYLICAGLCFVGARFWRADNKNSTAVTYLQILGGFILFALLNVEIASYFSQGKMTLSLNFCGEVAEAAAYTIAWVLCGAGCLFAAAKSMKVLKKAGIALVGLALLKLFLSDIWQLPLASRITVSIVVAVILLGISFYFQESKPDIE